jgi:hypothetical protein
VFVFAVEGVSTRSAARLFQVLDALSRLVSRTNGKFQQDSGVEGPTVSLGTDCIVVVTDQMSLRLYAGFAKKQKLEACLISLNECEYVIQAQLSLEQTSMILLLLVLH